MWHHCQVAGDIGRPPQSTGHADAGISRPCLGEELLTRWGPDLKVLVMSGYIELAIDGPQPGREAGIPAEAVSSASFTGEVREVLETEL
jgi:hypothetical protein